MRVREAAERLEVSIDTVYSLIGAGKLRCNRIGLGRGTIRISQDHLDEFLAATTTGPKVVAAPKPKVKEYVPRKNHGFRL